LAYRRHGVDEVISYAARWPTSAAQFPAQPEQRHDVAERERDRRDRVDVRAVRVVEAQPPQHLAVELGVHAVEIPAAVLVGLDLDQRSLGASAQPRQRPAVRVGLLELVDRAMRDELDELAAIGPTLEVLRQRRPVVGGDQFGQPIRHRTPARRNDHVAAQRAQQVLLEIAAQGDGSRLPLPGLGHVLEPAVVEFEEDPQRQLEVLVRQRIGRRRRRRRHARRVVRAQGVDQPPRERTSGFGQEHRWGSVLFAGDSINCFLTRLRGPQTRV
jgi:hypothetical protein